MATSSSMVQMDYNSYGRGKMSKGESCDVRLFPQGTATGTHKVCSRCAIVAHSFGSALAAISEEASVSMAQVLGQHSTSYHADLLLVK